jgi:hypothetical protein
MLKFLETNSTVISQDTFTNKFTGKKVLVMGSGPSVNLVNWKNLDYDCIVTTSFFYLNDEIRNLPSITHVTLTDLVDLEHPNLIEFLAKNPNCTVAFEPKSHPFYETEKYKKFTQKYKEQIIYYNTQHGKKEGVAGRVCYFTIQFSPSDLYYVGIDGKSPNPENDPQNAFRTQLRGDADGYAQSEFIESHLYFAGILYQTSLQTKTKLHNLGEGFGFNCSTPYSKQYFPLSEETKQKINYD